MGLKLASAKPAQRGTSPWEDYMLARCVLQASFLREEATLLRCPTGFIAPDVGSAFCKEACEAPVCECEGVPTKKTHRKRKTSRKAKKTSPKKRKAGKSRRVL